MTFSEYRNKIAEAFNSRAKDSSLFYKNVDRDKIFEEYLKGFEDPDFRQGYNCNCCKSFMRQYGGLVLIDNIDYSMVSIWELVTPPEDMKKAIANLVVYSNSLPITDKFYTDSKKCGIDMNRTAEGNTWTHFSFTAPSKYLTSDVDYNKGAFRTMRAQLERAITTISDEALNTVLELCESKTLYRGTTYLSTLRRFLTLRNEHSAIPNDFKNNYLWLATESTSSAVIAVRNSSIGSLLVDLSEGVDLDVAVRKFERIVAPTNYKRTTALVSKKQISEAQEKLKELGLISALERGFATPEELPVEKMLFVDSTKQALDVFEEMTDDADKRTVSKNKLNIAEETTIDQFITDIVPEADSIELLVENAHLPKFACLVNGPNSTSSGLFKWQNDFSWSYTGGITDAIKERVKKAGGNVTGVLRCSLAWSNYDDLDIHLIGPDNMLIKYNRKSHGYILDGNSRLGALDVDMNAGGTKSRTPVENIIFTHMPPDGKYILKVNQYNRRETSDVGYQIQVEFMGELFEFFKSNNPAHGKTDIVCKFEVKNGAIVLGKEGTITSKEKWNVNTNTFVKVKQMCLSPNYWEELGKGNKHYMFLLEDCKADESITTFFNEFLNDDLHQYRKVFEIMGSKLKIAPAEEQVAGVSFSETIAAEAIVRVKNERSNKLVKIKF